MKKRKIKKLLLEFLWDKISNREYTYSKEGLEKIKKDLIQFFNNLFFDEISIVFDMSKFDFNEENKEESYIPKIIIKDKTKPKFIITGFGPLRS